MKKFLQKIPKNIKILILAIVAVLVVVLIVRAIMHKGSRQKEVLVPEAAIEQSSIETSAPKSRIRRRPSSMQQKGTMDYATAVTTYVSRSVQFGELCQALPTAVTYKAGTSIMLDNRSSKPAVIAFGTKTYTLAAYGYQIAVLDTEGAHMLDCNDKKNVVTITIQK